MKALRTLRIVLALGFLTAVTLLFLNPGDLMHPCLDWVARLQFLPAVLSLNFVVVVAVLLVTLLVGRVYCSVVCPLGVMQDLFSWLGGKVKKNRFRYTRGLPVVRILFLVAFVLLMLLGMGGLAILIAPYSAYGRIATMLLAPAAAWLTRLVGSIGWEVTAPAKAGLLLLVPVATLLVVGAMSFFWGRLWCNTVCPVGSTLGLFSRFSLIRPTFDTAKCNGCRKCEHNCKAMCIDVANHHIDTSRCVDCMDCLAGCRQGALSLRPAWGKGTSATSPAEAVDGSRRKFLVTTAAVGAAMALEAQEKKIDGGLAVLEDKQLHERQVPLKPFGSQGVNRFAGRCTACQLCVSACPDHVLRPSTGLNTLLQPEMVFDKGFCRPDCTRCGDVCPTGAILPLTPAEKSAVSIGYAVHQPSNCLLSKGVSCDACSRHCPSGAIRVVPDAATGHVAIAVDENRCLGCGACEYYCPVRPVSAIYVEGREVHTSV